MKTLILAISAFFIISGYMFFNGNESKAGIDMTKENKNLQTATFAGGCFWCTESDFEKVKGVTEVISGYTGGHKENPGYKEVSAGTTGHVEAIQVIYDPVQVTYKELLQVLWHHIDPTDSGGQFVDRGAQYRSAVFYQNEDQKKQAEESKAELAKSGRFKKPVVTEIIPFTKFYRAEDYHQDYYKKNSLRYNFYRLNSGRDRFLKKTWADSGENNSGPPETLKYARPGAEALRQKLTPLQYKVTQEEGTEPAFHNEYWENKRHGIYVDIVSGEPLFSSFDKYDSGTGWPSFTKPLVPENIVEKIDKGLFTTRTEVRSKNGDSHLGHLFPDGPKPAGLRYCLNSASLRFIPKEDLEKEGYVRYLEMFKGVK